MAVPIGAGMSLRDVKTNMEAADATLTINSLKDAINNAHYADFNPTYYTFPPNSLRDFQGYNHIVDTTPPTAPSNLVATVITNTTFTLSWTASTDNRAISTYKIYKNGSFYADVGNVLTANIINQTAGGSATWTVIAFDESGNNTTSAGLFVIQGVTVTSTLMSKVGRTTGALACADTIDWTRYITGGDGIISDGEKIYNNSNGTDPLNGGGNIFSDGTNSFTVSTNGVVSLINLCGI